MNDKCEIVAEVIVYLNKHQEDGAERLREFLNCDKLLLDTDDVMRLTGWGRTYVSNLCTSGQLPHIKSKPHKFVLSAVREALEEMQQGGKYGRRKSKKTTRRTP